MPNYTVSQLAEVPEKFGDSYPGEFRPFKNALGTEQVAFTYRKMPRHTGAKGGYGHRHREQEEVVYVLSGTLQFKLDDDVVDVTAPAAVKISPGTAWGMWNDRPADAELLIISNRREGDDSEKVEGFWPAS